MAGFDPATHNSSTAKYTLGGVYWLKGKAYRYVQFLDAVTYAAGHVCIWGNAAGTAVTNDKDGTTIVDTVGIAGIAMGVMTQNYYGFMQVAGVATVLGDAALAAGEFCVSDSVDGGADTMADGEEEQVFGLVLTDSDATTLLSTVMLKGLI